MSRVINFTLLNKSELEYEVKIRLETPALDLVSLKKQILLLLKTFPNEDVVVSTLPLEEDVNQIELTLQYVEERLDSLQRKFTSVTSKKVRTYINHLFFRFERLEQDNCPPSLSDKIDTLRTTFEECESKYHSLTGEVEQNIFLDAVAQIPAASVPVPQSSVLLHDQTPVVTASTIQPQIVQVATNTNIINDIKKLTFSGDSCPKSFLQKLEEFRISRSITHERLLDNAFEIFTGKALHWLRFQKNRDVNLSWAKLSELLIQDFSSFDYDFKLLSAINSRTQGEDETIIIYVSIMYEMFSRLNQKLSEPEQLQILLRNIRPCYSVFVALCDITSIDSLLLSCQKYERILDRDRNFKEPQNSDNSQLFGDFHYKNIPQSNNKQFNYGQTLNNNSKFSQSNYQTKNNFRVNAITARKFNAHEFCVRCRVNGHSLSTCTQPKFLICFGCGHKGVKQPDCPDCKKNCPSTSTTKN